MIRRIYNFGELYLTRLYLLRTPWLSAYLHIFHLPDPGRDLHNHPWDWCFTWVLWGGYVEELEDAAHFRRAPWFRTFPGRTYHTILRLLRTPTITLFAHGKAVRTWTFLEPDGSETPWYDYLVKTGANLPEEIDALRERYKE